MIAATALCAAALLADAAAGGTPAAPDGPVRAPLATVAVRSAGSVDGASYDGVVQAVRQTTVGAQVPGAVVAIEVRAGDAVKAGQVLLRLDARAADQVAAAGAAQVLAAKAAQDAATREFERQQQLYEKQFISRSALERAEAQHKAAQAQAAAQLASAGAARTESGFYVVRAPYAAVVADVAVVQGDMAMPGRPLLTLYDPSVLRISVAVPRTAVARLSQSAAVTADVPGVIAGRLAPLRVQVLPMVDAASHTQELRLDLPPGLAGLAPGMFARAWLPADSADTRLYVPAAAVVRRAELSAVYVVGADGRPMLRQVRLGRTSGGDVEVLTGLSAGERVAIEPQAAGRSQREVRP
ncbi:efflux RND transporter periplasmic adaptor subunit [Aquabacterium humicola]|uniref:efflux RND transporter periplasmic adaptor subunit n=1 Tax=Aquabacterium humicola TaxID=3237377 RepID=UPI0025439739|nr:efflux RND transporter periplasmic adaptor subunit [Rubrivivax pictus]